MIGVIVGSMRISNRAKYRQLGGNSEQCFIAGDNPQSGRPARSL
ncbi:MAG: hypothetical protein ACRYG4_02750 [Janthinobacterium lividum]